MFLKNVFQPLYPYPNHIKFLAISCFLFLSAPVWAQTLSGHSLCRAYEQHLRNLDYNIALTTRQAMRVHQLLQGQQQVKNDAKRFSCYPEIFSKRAVSEQCHYIGTAQQRIATALNQISVQAATPQQRQMRQAIYMDMRYYNCRNPQSLERLMQENNRSEQALPRKRNKPAYKKQKSLQQASLQRAVINLAEPESSDVKPAKAMFTHVPPLLSIPQAPNIDDTKAADSAPPPVFHEPAAYVSDPKIRRVGPAYVPAQ